MSDLVDIMDARSARPDPFAWLLLASRRERGERSCREQLGISDRACAPRARLRGIRGGGRTQSRTSKVLTCSRLRPIEGTISQELGGTVAVIQLDIPSYQKGAHWLQYGHFPLDLA